MPRPLSSHRRRFGRCPTGQRGASPRPGADEGFTLIELLVVLVILPIVVAAIATGLIAVFSIQGSVSTRVADSGDAQLVSENFVPDVQSALQVTTDASASQCGPGTQLLGLESNLNSETNIYETVVSYVEVKEGATYVLVREDCSSGPSTTPSSSTIVSFNIEANLPAPIVYTGSNNTIYTAATSGWVPAQNVTNIQFSLIEPETHSTNYTYTLSAIPETSAPPSSAGSPIVADTTTTCGFAPTDGGTVSNGTYAQTLCFVDFSSYNASDAAYPNCQTFVASIPGGDTLSFCMSESGNEPMFAAALPTYPEAFLGNTLKNAQGISEPFYTALGCSDSTPPETSSGGPTPSCINPAMYQEDTNVGPTNTLDFTNIAVTTPTGSPATGWEWVSADAETTDSNEYITWTSNKDLNLLYNSPGSPYGDTCNNEPNWNGPQGLGTTQVTCESGSQETGATKTGTPMLEALTPTSMTITMKGAGLEGIAVGLLLS